MRFGLAALVLLAAGTRGCLTYEFEHEFWLKTDGSGRVHITGPAPELLADPQLAELYLGGRPVADAAAAGTPTSTT